MIAAKTTLTLILPGLSEVCATTPPESCPRLHRLTGRAVRGTTGSEGYEQALMDALDYQMPDRASLPGAQCSYLTDFDESAPLHCARADPVYLRAEQDHGRLVSADSLALQAADARSIVDDLNDHFAEDALYFSIGQKDRWYMSGKPSSGLDSAPTSLVTGRNVASFLPLASDAASWRQLATEVQMLLHSHPVNDRRANAGLMPVNALWFWGAGKIHNRVSVTEYRLFSNAAFALGLGKLTGLTVYPLQDVAVALGGNLPRLLKGQVQGQVNNVIVMDSSLLEAILAGDHQRQSTTLQAYEEGLFRYAERLLRRGAINCVVIDTCDGHVFELERHRLFRFWIRKPVLRAGVNPASTLEDEERYRLHDD